MKPCCVCGRPAEHRNSYGICRECMRPVEYDDTGARIDSVFDWELEREPDDDELLPSRWWT